MPRCNCRGEGENCCVNDITYDSVHFEEKDVIFRPEDFAESREMVGDTGSLTDEEILDLAALISVFMKAPAKWPHDPPEKGDVCQDKKYWHVWIGGSDTIMMSIPKRRKDAAES